MKPSDWREARRIRAWELHQQGWTQTQIARALGVSDAAVSKWMKRVREGGGISALRRGVYRGAPARLKESQYPQLEVALAQGASAYGFEDDTWTQPRVAVVIEQVLGIRYSSRQAGRILRKMGWTPQKFETRALQRNEKTIQQFKDDWSAIEKNDGRRLHHPLSGCQRFSFDTDGGAHLGTLWTDSYFESQAVAQQVQCHRGHDPRWAFVHLATPQGF
jgi:transposase